MPADARVDSRPQDVKPVRILVADDHGVVRSGMRALLESQRGWTVCGEASTGREAVAKALELRPDLTVLDVSMPEVNGLEAARQIRRAGAGAVVIITAHAVDDIAEEAFAAGASGCVLKGDPQHSLVDAVGAVLQGRRFLSGKVEAPDASAAGAAPRLEGRRISSLSPREREVLRLLAEGRSNKEIGSILGITTKTAETHRTRVMAKLDVHSMAELVRFAIRKHVIEP
jgi:DNA-binding NarL/FixJ family response regulator